jgi:hypothetical protein
MEVWLQAICYLIGACLVWCLLTHCVFMRLCTCLKRRSKLRLEMQPDLELRSPLTNDPKWRLLAAHRGGSAEACENTVDAFDYARSRGLNYMECDVQLSKDGQVVIAHDSTLERMCGPEYAGKSIGDYDFEDLPAF